MQLDVQQRIGNAEPLCADRIGFARLTTMAFRGTEWMQEPCRSCPKAKEDFGGCRCQAFALTGDARATDPVCHLSPRHALVAELAEMRADLGYEYRR